LRLAAEKARPPDHLQGLAVLALAEAIHRLADVGEQAMQEHPCVEPPAQP
jgi:hypothetical protein